MRLRRLRTRIFNWLLPTQDISDMLKDRVDCALRNVYGDTFALQITELIKCEVARQVELKISRFTGVR